MRNNTILLVEDEAIIALSQSQTIESYGYRVITAMSGEEALEIITGNQSIDLVLMDIDLGAGMDGTETAERIMEIRMLPIVFLTSHTEKEMVDRVKGITRYGYVVKNSGEFVLMESINMAFELYEAHSQINRGQVFARLADRNEQELDAMIMARSLDPDDHQQGQIITVTDMTGQLKNEKLIKKSEYEKSLILNAMYEHVVYYTPDMKIQWANRAACEAVGKQPGEVEGMHCYEVWHGRMEPCENCPVQVDEEKCRQKNYTATSQSGREWEVNVYPVCDEGEITAYIELSREVTEKRVIEKKLQESERRFRELADMLPEIVFEADIHGRIIYGNRAAFEVMGYTREDFENELEAVEMVVPEDRERVTQNITRLIHGEEVGPVEYRALRKSGQTFPAIISSSLIVDDGTIQGLRGIVIDISRIRAAMENLENNRNMLQAILQNMPGGTILIDDEYTILQVNDRTCQVTGYELTELIGEKCDIICPKGSDSKMCPIWEEGQRDFMAMDTTVKHKDGSRVPVLKNARRLVLDGREYVLENFQDITEIKKARKEIENLLMEKEILLREVHHRIKNDMNVIGSLLSLQAKSADNPEVSKNLDEVFNRIRIMGSIYNTLYRGEQVSRLNIRSFLYDVADSVIQVYTLSTSVMIKKDIVDAWIPARLSFPLGIMVNELLTNAFKYAFQDRNAGMIDISVKLDENQNLRVCVRDDGRGIPEQAMQPAGFGFGLTILDAMVRQCRGEYTISNTDGTRVDIIIPYTNE